MVDPVHERLTPRGRGAVSSFLVTGPADWLDLPVAAPRFRAANGQPLAQQPVGAILFGALSLAGGAREEVVACRLRLDQLELHCHGGEAVATRVAELLTEAGFRPQANTPPLSAPTDAAPNASPAGMESGLVNPPGMRSTGSAAAASEAAGTCSPSVSADVERPNLSPLRSDRAARAPLAVPETAAQRRRRLRELVLRAATPRTAVVAHAQYHGALVREIVALLQWPPSSPEVIQRLRRLLALAPVGRHLAEPFAVGVVGRPNVGKSSLINALLGFERSIVLDLPGTTRDVLTSETACGGWPIRLADTAGFRAGGEVLEQQGIARARDWLARADLVLLVLDGSQGLTAEDESLRAEFPAALRVITKCDLPPGWNPELVADGLRVSAQTKAGLADLLTALTRRLVPQAPTAKEGVPTSEAEVAQLEAALGEWEQGHWAAGRACLLAWVEGNQGADQ
jgi:tRNA modification GTPase